METKNAISPVIAVILLLAITVVISMSIYSFLQDYSNNVTSSLSSNVLQQEITIEYLFSNNLVINSNSNYNLSLLQITDVSGNQLCSFSEKFTINSSNLMVWYNFDNLSFNGSHYFVNDLSGNSNHGVLYDANISNSDGNTPPQLVNSNQGKALLFDGLDDYVKINYGESFNSSIHNQTFVTKFRTFNKLNVQVILDQGNGGGDGRDIFRILDPSNPFGSEKGGDISTALGGGHFSSNIQILNDEWQIPILRYTANNSHYTQDLFINSFKTINSNSNPEGSGKNLTLGISESNFLHSLNGEIDELIIYNSSLLDSEIKKLYWYLIQNQSKGKSLIDISSCNLQKNKQYNILMIANGEKIQSTKYVN